jgi:hypothetical protein
MDGRDARRRCCCEGEEHMILHKENLKEDAWGMREVARTLSTYENNCNVYDLTAGDGYEEEEGHPLCVVMDYGNRFDVVFNPYSKRVRRKIFLEYNEADCLMKLLCYIDKQLKSKEKEEEKNT